MKYVWVFAGVLAGVLSVSAAVSEDRLDALSDLVEIDSVRDFSEDRDSGEQHIIKVEFSSESEGMDDVWFRVAVELTDKAAKKAYLVEAMRQNGRMPSEDTYAGEGYWQLVVPCSPSEKMKVTAYVIQYGVMDGETFVPFTTECDKVKTYSELAVRPHENFSGDWSLSMTVMIAD